MRARVGRVVLRKSGGLHKAQKAQNGGGFSGERDVFDPVRPEAYRIRLDDGAMRAAATVLSPEQMRALELIRKGMEKSWQ